MEVYNLKSSKDEKIKEDVANLYLSAFPSNERPPIEWYFRAVYGIDNNQILVFYDNKEYIGYAHLCFYQDIIYICYLAVNANKRNLGYGSKILNYVRDNYPRFTILLCFEEVDEKYSDNEMRKRRMNFYIRNGFTNNHLKTREGEVIYQSSRIGDRKVTFDIYQKIFDLCYGERASENYLRFVSDE